MFCEKMKPLGLYNACLIVVTILCPKSQPGWMMQPCIIEARCSVISNSLVCVCVCERVCEGSVRASARNRESWRDSWCALERVGETAGVCARAYVCLCVHIFSPGGLGEIQVHWLKLNKPPARVFILPMMRFGRSFQCLFAKTSDSISEENQRNQTTNLLEYFL
jgi:hypothetical protein